MAKWSKRRQELAEAALDMLDGMIGRIAEHFPEEAVEKIWAPGFDAGRWAAESSELLRGLAAEKMLTFPQVEDFAMRLRQAARDARGVR